MPYMLSSRVIKCSISLSLSCLPLVINRMRRIETGVARGSGMQDIGAYVNLAAYYLCGIPTAIILAFRLKMGGAGLWIGITGGSFVQSVLLGLIATLTNWQQQVRNMNKMCYDTVGFHG